MAEVPETRAFQQALLNEFTRAVDAVLGSVTAAPTDDRAEGPGWRLTAAVSGDLAGSIVVWVDHEGSARLAQRVMGLDDAPDAATVADMLREMWGQAAGATSLREPFTGVKLALSTAEAADAPSGGVVCDLSAGEGLARVAVAGDAAPAARHPELAVRAPAPAPVAHEKLDVVLDMELPMVVRFARTVMTLKALSGLGPGSIVDMERSPDEPVQVLIGDRIIAHGEVVVVGGNYGVRVTELVSPGDRVRQLEA